LLLLQLLLISRIGLDGRMNGNIHKNLSENTLLKVQTQVSSCAWLPEGFTALTPFALLMQLSNEEHSSHLSAHVEHKGDDFCAHASAANGVTCTVGYLQSITHKLAVGGKLIPLDITFLRCVLT
jgi:hypothetical protein